MSIKIPQYQNQVNISHQGDAYLTASNNPDAFGRSIFEARENLYKSAQDLIKGASDAAAAFVKAKELETASKALELSNYIDELDRTALSDPENGYYAKMGKDAMRNDEDASSGAIGVLTGIDDKIRQKQKELGLTSGQGAQMAELIRTRKMKPMYKGAFTHELKQRQYYYNIENETAVNEAVSRGIQYRDDAETRETAFNTGREAIIHNAKVQHYDEGTLALKLQNYESKFHAGIIQRYLKNGELEAGEYFKKYQDKLLPDTRLALEGAVRNNELKYISKAISNDLFVLYPDNEAEAVKELDKKNLKPDEYDEVSRELHHKYSEKQRLYKQEQDKLIDDFYSKALPLVQQGGALSYDLIPEGINAKDKISLMRYINSNGSPETDDAEWEELYEKSVSDAAEFADIDLNRYRGVLSKTHYNQLEKRQKQIKQGGYYTYIADDDKKIKKALESLGLKKGKMTSSFNEIRYIVREFEAKRGRSITKNELMNITNSLGYKGDTGVKIYKSLEKGLASRTGFIRDVITDFIQYQDEHNGELPPDDVKDRIIRNRIADVIQKQNEEAFEKINPPPLEGSAEGENNLPPLPKVKMTDSNNPYALYAGVKSIDKKQPKNKQYKEFVPEAPYIPPSSNSGAKKADNQNKGWAF